MPFYMFLGDTREGGVVPRSTAEMEVEVMELRMLHTVWQREELLRVRLVDRAPGIRLSRTTAPVDDCDAYRNFRVLKEDMACLEDIKGPCRPITFTEKAFPGRIITIYSGRGCRSVSCHTRQPNSSERRSVSGHTRQLNSSGRRSVSCYTRQPNLTGLLLST